ncbi:hypothetical protein GO730_15280 [Spirosoma sp. HMF3257]|uniref:Uncharacterized protein n=1 Tax=Spirosoma telluris TaxID=2183553 RepID=A0A327NIQ4_9BACT|nr:hypothetical protein [Spirosoma telluris]RAI75210.1 hypothetical protein HMF3257_15225 [Spirosoma telluris]
MKMITLINWAIVGIYLLMLLLAFTSSNSQQDAAGRGMAAGLLVMACVFLGLLVTLNLLPYPFGRITAMILGGVPLVAYVLSQVVGPLLSDWRRKRMNMNGVVRPMALIISRIRLVGNWPQLLLIQM